MMIRLLCLALATLTVIQCRPSEEQTKYRDCYERWKMNGETVPGVYTIYPNGTYPIKVYCNHSSDASFTVIQRRMAGTETFYRGWHDYEIGFGHPQADYWAGLRAIHSLTASGNNVLHISLQDWAGNNRYAIYKHFLVNSASDYYRMYASGFSGNVPDDLSYQNGRYFYTPDRPDQYQCAVHQKGGWWFNYCSYAFLNGHYYPGGPYSPTGSFYDGIYWKDWLGYGYSLKFVSMSLYRA